MWLGSAFSGIPVPPQNLWQSRDSGETKTLAAWADGYVLLQNNDGTITARTKFSNGIPPLTLVRVAGPNQNPFSAESEKPVITNRQSSNDQWWEHPDDILITTGICQNMTQSDACTNWQQEVDLSQPQSYTGDLYWANLPEDYKQAKTACEGGCDGDWTVTYDVLERSTKMWDLTTDKPHRLPRGWRVDSKGHLTNLPAGLDVTAANALENGVAIIRPQAQNANAATDNSLTQDTRWKIMMPCVFYTNAGPSQYSEQECSQQGYEGTEIFNQRHLDWAIAEGNKNHKDFGGQGQLYWWLESPTFIASCSDPNSPQYNADAHYWDNTLCDNSNEISISSQTSDEVQWGGLVAAGLAITVLSVGATIYGGRI